MDAGGDKVRTLIAERARERYGRSGHDMRKAADGEDTAGWMDRMVSLGHYAPSARGGMNEIEIGNGALVATMQPATFSDRYGHVPPEFAARWLEMQRSRPHRKSR